MITVFNRKELITTYDMDELANAKDDLRNAGIDFKISKKHSNGGSISRIGRGMNIGIKYRGVEYTLYVREQDYKNAVFIIHNKEDWK